VYKGAQNYDQKNVVHIICRFYCHVVLVGQNSNITITILGLSKV